MTATDVHSFASAVAYQEVAKSHKGKLFHANEHKLPESVPLKQKDISKAYKPVGPASNQRSAVATAWVAEHDMFHFADAPHAWLGSLVQVVLGKGS